MKTALLALYAAALLRWGFGSRGGFASWHMFAGSSLCRFDLVQVSTDGRNSPFNPWDHLPHTLLTMDREHMLFFLSYLRVIKRLRLHGRVELRAGGTTRTYHVENTHVVA